MANVQLAWDNQVANGITPMSDGYGTYTSTLTNLGKWSLSQKWVSPGLTAANTRFTIDLQDRTGNIPDVALVALCTHNLSLAATVRVRLDSGPAFVSPLHDSGTQNAFFGGVTEARRRGLRQNYVWKLPSPVTCRYLRVDISDASNAAGYVSVGRLFVARNVWQPSSNMLASSNGLIWESNSETQKAIGGGEWFVDAEANRVARFTLNPMPRDEVMDNAFDLNRVGAGPGREVIFQWDPASANHQVRMTMLGRLRQLSALEEPQYGYMGNAFEVKELL